MQLGSKRAAGHSTFTKTTTTPPLAGHNLVYNSERQILFVPVEREISKFPYFLYYSHCRNSVSTTEIKAGSLDRWILERHD